MLKDFEQVIIGKSFDQLLHNTSNRPLPHTPCQCFAKCAKTIESNQEDKERQKRHRTMDAKFFYDPQNSTADATDDSQGVNLGTDATGVEEEFEDISFEDLKLAAQDAHFSLKKMKEPYFSLVKVRDALRRAIITDRMGTEQEFADYVNSTLGIRLMPQLARERSSDEGYLEVCAGVLEAWIRLFLDQMKKKRFNDKFICAVTWCFQPQCSLHMNHFHFTNQELKQIAMSHQTWRNEIAVGGSIDVLVKADKVTCWLLGKVTHMRGDMMHVEFEQSIPEYDLVIDRWSTKIAPAGQNSKADAEWREETFIGKTNVVCDANDGQDWLEATIFETQMREVGPNRVVPYSLVGFRVYRTTGKKLKEDAMGVFEGWGQRYDEWTPLHSPYLAPHLTKSQGQGDSEKVKMDEELDNVIQPSYGFDRVYAVPRIHTCISKKFLYFMDLFGNLGGFDTLLDVMENQELEEKNLNLTSIGYMITLFSMSSNIWHKRFIEEYGPRFCNAIEKRFLESDDKNIRELDQSCSYQAIVATKEILVRIMSVAQANQSMEVFKLKFIKRCLESQFLEKRIQGIKELNEIVTEATIGNDSQALAIIKWITTNGVFQIIWEPKKTHIQLVQRSGDILRCFLKADLLSEELLAQFWHLTKSDYKLEVFKILNEVDFYLEQAHMEYIFQQITQTQATKLGVEEFDILAMLGRRGKAGEFSNQVSIYFWRIISNSEAYSQEVLECCIAKFAEMAKYWPIGPKKPFFDALVSQLKANVTPTIPMLQLFQKFVSDHKDRERITSKHSSMGQSRGVNYGNLPKWVSQEQQDPVECRHLFDELEESQQISLAIIGNLTDYFEQIQGKQPLAGQFGKSARTEIKILSKKYFHHEEVEERLKFLQLFAANSSFELTKQHLKLIYDCMAGSPVQTDVDQFLKWCKGACENLSDQIVDLSEVGEFFSQQITAGVFDLRSMPLTGFFFIQMFFVSANITAYNLIRREAPKRKKEKPSFNNDWNNLNVFWDEPELEKQPSVEDDLEKETPYFTVLGDPASLQHLDIIWQIVLQSEKEEVYVPAINLLVYSHLSTEGSRYSEEQRSNQLSAFLAKCFELIKPEANPSSLIVRRVTQVIKEVVQQSEKCGMMGIRPHRSILKGELMDRIIVRYMNQPHRWADERVERAFILKLYTSCTVWEFKAEVAKLLGLAPKYLEFEFPCKKIIEDKQHGLDMQQLGLKNNQVITARKIEINEYIPEAPLTDPEKQWLVPRAEAIFTEWFELFKNPVKGVMDSYSVARFISRSTGSSCISSDDHVIKLIRDYDNDGDGALNLAEFLQFYYDAAEFPGTKRDACFDNLSNMNVRPDLLKLSEVVEHALFESKTLMPRFALQANEEQYQILWNLLGRADETCQGVWELIQMLATNEKQYLDIIEMGQVTDEDGEVDWASFFEGSSIYQKTYLQQIILSVLEDSEDSGDEVKRIMFVLESKVTAASYQISRRQENRGEDPAGPASEDQLSPEEQERQEKIAQLRLNWSRNFLEKGGLQFIMQQLYALDVNAQEPKQTEFMLTLARVFLSAAFATDPQKQIGQAVRLARKSSSIDDGDALDKKLKEKKEDASKDKIQELLKAEFGMEILLSTNYGRLQNKILSLVFSILQQNTFSLEQKIIIENAITIWVGATLYKPELFNDFKAFTLNGSSAEDLILSGLVFCSEEKIRQDFCSGLTALVKSIDQEKRQETQRYFMGILGSNFREVAERPCSQYFDLFNELIDLQALQDALVEDAEYFEEAKDGANYNPETLLNQIIEKILESQVAKDVSVSTLNAQDDEILSAEKAAAKERLLVGLITLTQKIIQTGDKEVSDRVIQDKNLVNQMFKTFLFSSYFQQLEEEKSEEKKEVELIQRCGKNQPKNVQSNKRSREAAFSLLIELLRKSEVSFVSFLQNILSPMLNSVEKPRTWNYQPPSKDGGEGRVQEYVGLRNLGCICYMNSMMQQFFMIPVLRYNLLCIDDGKPEELVEYKNKMVDDNMFHQMQKLFAHLELSERMDYNPFGFCFAFKEFDGNPTIISEQKDAQEFLNLLFDRLETALKPTNRKYLLQGIFGGKQCSQMVCTECGKVKNRHEDFLNLSLNIKDIKSVYESLQKQVDGETISDYQCDGCNRKVDLSRRTLIAETPNILIVHLQRIGFNFETFETDKMNTLCKFPTMLDLKPYSYFDVMGKENRLKEQQAEQSTAEALRKKQEEEDAMTEEELQKRKEAEEETREPKREDCFEYKLVGVNVHSGTANMGHYWSYINTNRGTEEKEGAENQWIRTDLDPWMEFNDSRVTHFDYKDLERQCFGNEQGAGFMGDSYGTSGYMLFYERRQKKPLKILIEEDQVEAEKAKGTEVHIDEENKESYKMVPYYDSALGEKANPIYQQVFEDNHNVKFENDIYSQEFFDFVLNVMEAAAQSDSEKAKQVALRNAKKVGFEILVRCLDTSGITQLHEVMIKILKSSDNACKFFMQELLEDDDAEPVMEILFDCNDSMARRNLIKVIRYLICRLKEIEKDEVLSGVTDTQTQTVVNMHGEQVYREILTPRALCLKFMAEIFANMRTRAARNWKIIDTYMDVLLSFGVQSPEDVEKEQGANAKPTWTKGSVGYRTGMTELMRKDFLAKLGDFILQDSSPLYGGDEDFRFQMGNYYMQPNFEKGLLLCSLLMAETDIQQLYPLTENAIAVSQSKSFLQHMIKATNSYDASDAVDFSEMLNMMCINNLPNTKKMGKAYLRELIQKSHVDDIQKGLKNVRGFLQIKDSLRRFRFEWVFGVPQVFSKRNHQRKNFDLGISAISFINQEAYQFKSAILKGHADGLLTDMFKAQRTRIEFTILALLDILELCIEDDMICEYIYKLPPATYQYSRFCDWFEPFATEQRAHFVEQNNRYTVYQDIQNKQNVETLTQILSLIPQFKEKCAKYEAEWRAQREQAKDTDFEGYKAVSMVGEPDTEVIDHYPPQYIIGQAIRDTSGEEPVALEQTEHAIVSMHKIEVEYMYGNPTGLFNLSLPEMKLRNIINYRDPERTYAQWKRSQASGAAAEFRRGESTDGQDPGTEGEEEDYEGLNVRHWHDHSLVTEIYKIEAQIMVREQVKVMIQIEQEDETEPLNCHIPATSFSNTILQSGISTKPATALIVKIDPSKPLPRLKMSVSSKIKRAAMSSYNIADRSLGAVMGARLDPTYSSVYRNCVNEIQERGQRRAGLSMGNIGGNTVSFFISQGGNDDRNGGILMSGGTRLGLEGLSHEPMENQYDEDADGEDGEADYASNENNAGDLDASDGDEQMRFQEEDMDGNMGVDLGGDLGGDDLGDDLGGYAGMGGQPM